MPAIAQRTMLLDIDDPDRFQLGIDIEHRESEVSGLLVGAGRVLGHDELRTTLLDLRRHLRPAGGSRVATTVRRQPAPVVSQLILIHWNVARRQKEMFAVKIESREPVTPLLEFRRISDTLPR